MLCEMRRFCFLLCLLIVSSSIGEAMPQTSCSSAGGDWMSNVALSSVVDDSAIVTWSPVPGDSSAMFVVQYREQGSTDFTDSVLQDPNSTSHEVMGLKPSTHYEVQVCRLNDISDCGFCLLSFQTQSDRGVLFIVHDGEMFYLELSEQTVFEATSSSFVLENFIKVYNNSTVKGIDFHFERSELYLTTSNEIRKLNFNLTKTGEGVVISLLPGETVLVSRDATLGAIAVDWLNNHLYWIEYSGTAKLVRADIDGSSPCCVYSLESGHNISLFVDPLHGYIYWNSQTELLRVSLSEVQSEDCACADFSGNSNITDANLYEFILDLSDPIIYYAGVGGINSVTLEFMGPSSFVTSLSIDVTAMGSYDNTAIYSASLGDLFLFVNINGGSTIESSAAISSPISVMRSMRQSLQPLPIPDSLPTNVRVFTTSTQAVVNWDMPQYTSELFGDSAFRQWTYIIKYSLLGSMDEVVFNTTELMATLTNLNPGSLYEMSISVSGSGGELMAEEALVFSTELPGTVTQILVGADKGVIQANVDGTSASIIGGIDSTATNGIAYDTWSNVYYWIIRGGQSTVFAATDPNSERDKLYMRRDFPLSLKLDWITQTLYWIEQSESVIVRASALSDTAGIPEPEVVLHSPPITALAIDSLHGVLFYISGDTIYLKTLNGLMDQLTCVPSSTVTPTAIAVDSVESVLYWIHGREKFTTINSLHYSEQSCDESFNSVEVYIAPGFNGASESGLEYYSGKLYISDFNSDKVYTVAANISAIEVGQTLAIGRIDFANVEFGSIRDIAFTSNSTQPIPDGLIADMRGNFAPSTPGSPPQLDPLSNSTNIIVTWSPSDQLPFSPIWYKLSYTTGASSEMKSIISSGTSVTLTDMLPPYTSVLASVTAYSLWSASEPTESATFFTPPQVPGPVNTVRAYVYNPVRGASNITALVVWDGLTHLEAGGIVTNYGIRLYRGGSLQLELASIDNSTQIVLEERSERNILSYPLVGNANYSITVFAINQAGNGPESQNFTFSTSGLSSPEEIVVFGSSGAEVVGLDGMQSSALQEVTAPLTVNTIEREVYWYSNQTLYRKSIDGGIEVALVSSSHASTLKSLFPVAFAYEWVGHTVYMAALRDGHFTLWRVPIRNPNGFELVYEDFETYHEEQIKVALTVDPFKGLAYWLDVAQGVLYKLDLTNPTAAETLTAAGGRRKRAGSLQEVDLAPALTLDSASGLLWVSDASTGDILTCSITSNMCGVEVSASALQMSSGQAEIGLPASSITLDEERIYWTNDNSSDIVFFVDRTSPTVLQMILVGSNISSLYSTSPGIQPFPSSNCLSPDFGDVADRPMPRQIANSNTSVTVEWDEPALPPECSGVTYSFPPLTFILDVKQDGMNISGYSPMVTYERTNVLISGLKPFQKYSLRVSGSNQYTVGDNYNPVTGLVYAFGPAVEVMTSEGVPEKPRNVTAIPSGTRTAEVSWIGPLDENELNGDINNLEFIIDFGGRVFTTTSTSFSASDLKPGSLNTISVQTSNGVFRSDFTDVQVMTWSLPPSPEVISRTSFSFTVSIVLQPMHSTIVKLSIQANETIQSSGKDVGDIGEQMNFTVGSEEERLDSFTLYELRAVALYSNGVSDNGEATTDMTLAGVPDPPEITNEVDDDYLSWNEPDPNGAPIRNYMITSILQSDTIIMEGNFTTVPSTTRRIHLPTQTNLFQRENEAYTLHVFAINAIGRSLGSDPVTYSYATNNVVDSQLVIGLAVSAGFVLILLVMVAICLIYCCISNQKKKLLRLSVLYGPDHELSNLRSYSRTQLVANNPHYMWCRDDFVCTDKDLEQLSKFPRQNLKLEMFIDRGEFGEVYQGTAFDILGPGAGSTPVAVKTLRKGATPEEQKKFLSEAALMSNFDHPNIVKVLGICVDNDPVYIIMELMPGGDLLKFLRDAKRENGPPLLTVQEQIQIALDVAQGCRYLEQQHYIHRDIAARNCLVSSRGADRVVKMGDFGLAKDLYTSDYYQVEGQRKLPVRWMAPEALLQGKFTIESDVWSFGVLLWEIMTLGNQPYPGRTNQEVLQFVTGGGRLDRPEKCPARLYHLMQVCWKRYTSQRPQFSHLVVNITSLLEHVKRESYYSDESDEEGLERQGSKKSGPSRNPSIRSGIISLARHGSMKLRNSIRRHSSLHKREERTVANNEDPSFRERGPF